MPLPSHVSIADDILRLRSYRNRICHDSICSSDFETIWEDVTCVLQRILGPSVLKEADKLKHESIDPVLGKKYQQVLNDWDKQDTEMKEHLQRFEANIHQFVKDAIKSELRSQASSVKEPKNGTKKKGLQMKKHKPPTEPKNGTKKKGLQMKKHKVYKPPTDAMIAKVGHWETADVNFCETRAFDAVMKAFERGNVVTIVGVPGSGKSMIAQHIAITLKSQGYDTYPLLHPEQVDEYYCKETKQLFLFDDPIGEHNVSENEVRAWKRCDETLKIVTKDPCIKLLIAVRSQVVKDLNSRDSDSKTVLTENIIDINLDSLKLNKDEREKLFSCHFPKVSPFEEVRVCPYDFFPVLCRDYNQAGNQNVFLYPFGFLIRLFKTIQEHSDTQFAGMLLCAAIENVPERIFQEGELSKSNKIVRKILSDFKSDENYRSIRKQLDFLCYVFIQKTDGKYSFIHEIFKDATLFVAAKIDSCYIFDSFSLRLINERVCIGSAETTDNNEYFLFLPNDEKVWKMMADRLRKGLEERMYSDVFNNPYISSPSIEPHLLQYMEAPSTKINMQDEANRTMLHWAVDKQNENYTKCLLECKINVDAKDISKKSALCIATSTENINITKLLLDYKADVNMCIADHGSLLTKATFENKTEMVKLLLDYKAKVVTYVDKYLGKQIPFHIAVQHNNIEIARLLADYNAELYNTSTGVASNFTANKPLVTAAKNDNIEMVKIIILLDKKRDWCKIGGDMSLLHTVDNNNLQMAKILLDNYEEANKLLSVGDLALLYAINHDNVEMVKLLLDNGAKVNSCCLAGKSALMRAVEQNNEGMVNMLLTNGADVNVYRGQSKTPLIHAVEDNNINLVKLLLANGADVNLHAIQDHSALKYAIEHNQYQITKLLMEHNADMHDLDPSETAQFITHILNDYGSNESL